MALLSKKSSSSCSASCKVSKWVVCALFFVAALAALAGVYSTHILTGSDVMRVQFGSSGGSLAIIAFVIATMAWSKQMMCCMSSCDACSK